MHIPPLLVAITLLLSASPRKPVGTAADPNNPVLGIAMPAGPPAAPLHLLVSYWAQSPTARGLHRAARLRFCATRSSRFSGGQRTEIHFIHLKREEQKKMANTQTPNEQPETTASQPPTAAQTTMLTIKLVVGAGLIIALFWFIDRAVS